MPVEERNDALKRGNRIAVERYEFAIKCLGAPRTVVDLGCGMGYGCHLLRRAGHQVCGLDYSVPAIKYAEENYPGDYMLQNLVEDGVEYEDEAAVCLEVLCHLKNPQEFVGRIKSKYLVISAPIDPNPQDGYVYRLHNLSEQQFKDMFKDWIVLDEFRQKQYLTLFLEKKV